MRQEGLGKIKAVIFWIPYSILGWCEAKSWIYWVYCICCLKLPFAQCLCSFSPFFWWSIFCRPSEFAARGTVKRAGAAPRAAPPAAHQRKVFWTAAASSACGAMCWTRSDTRPILRWTGCHGAPFYRRSALCRASSIRIENLLFANGHFAVLSECQCLESQK